MDEAFMFGASESGVFERFLAAASDGDENERQALASMAAAVPETDFGGEVDRAKQLLQATRSWAAGALEKLGIPAELPSGEIRTGDDAFHWWQTLRPLVERLDEQAVEDREAAACVREAYGAAQAGMQLGPLPAGGMASPASATAGPSVVHELKPTRTELLDLAGAAGRCLRAYSAASLGDILTEAARLTTAA
jgi:hypothetical protein